jgi:hypothetical protein
MKIRELLYRPFTLLDPVRYRWILILFSVFFSIFFINVFVPFNINHWSNDSGIDKFIRLSGFGIIAGLILIFSQFGLRKLTRMNHFRIGSYSLWLIGELFFMAATFIVYQSHGNIQIDQFLKDIPDSFKYTLLGVLIPYSLSLLLISQLIHQTKLKQLKTKIDPTQYKSTLLNFPDEKGIVRFSLDSEQILYLESADNYVIIFYLSGGKAAKQILRNSMKNIEGLLESTPLKRCHRSFMVNLQKIEFVDYGKSKCQLKLAGIENQVPVSRKFIPDFKPQL